MSNEERPYEPDWIIEHITPNGHKSSFYPLWIEGHHLDTGETFYWNVPDIEYWRHVLTPQAQEELAAIVEQARPARVDFWHPALPEVCRFAAEPEYDPPCPDETGVRLDSGRWAILAALLLFLLLPLAAHAAEPCKVNVNNASPAQLALLINTGPALAGKIAAARTAGPLDAAKLDAVPGVGEKWLGYNAPHVAYDGETTCKAKLKKPAAPADRKEAAGGGR